MGSKTSKSLGEFLQLNRPMVPFYEEFCKFTKVNKVNKTISFQPTPDAPPDIAQFVYEISRKGPSAASDAWATFHLCADGPKVFQPTRALCESLGRTFPRVGMGDYHQPYPTMCVELPKDFASQWSPAPVLVIVHHGGSFLIANTIMEDGFSLSVLLVEDGDTQLESLIQQAVGHEWGDQSLPASATETEMTGLLARIAINSCLLLVDRGKKEYSKNGHFFDRLERLKGKIAKGKGRGTIAEAEREQRLIPIILEFENPIVTGQSRREGGGDVKPHWRAGHIRRQRYGPALTLIKTIFISPVLVNSDKLEGDLAWTTVYQPVV